jgi:hypothetical protein
MDDLDSSRRGPCRRGRFGGPDGAAWDGALACWTGLPFSSRPGQTRNGLLFPSRPGQGPWPGQALQVWWQYSVRRRWTSGAWHRTGQAGRPAGRQTGRKAGRQAGRRAGWLAGWLAGWQLGQAGTELQKAKHRQGTQVPLLSTHPYRAVARSARPGLAVWQARLTSFPSARRREDWTRRKAPARAPHQPRPIQAGRPTR